MPRELTEPQRLWVEALRSGEFWQAKEALDHEGGYCCLGVACVIAERAGVEVRRYPKTHPSEYALTLIGGALDTQEPVMKWLGLKDDNGWVGDTCLTRLNDDGKTFREIADFIEAHADELFVEEDA